ncbi:MAG: CAP domain-containing protein [Chloroflexota bacterium]
MISRIRRVIYFSLTVLAIMLCIPFATRFARAQQDPETQLLTRINGERISNGLAPLARNPALDIAAKRHAADIVEHGVQDHLGSDGSVLADRLYSAGFKQYSTGYAASELIYVAIDNQQQAANLAFEEWLSSVSEKETILSVAYREMGLNVASNSERVAVVVILGSQVNELPVFLENGAPTASSPVLQLTLTNEGSAIEGDGPEGMGLAIEYRLAFDDQFSDQTWQPWTNEITVTSPISEGVISVFVEYRDRDERTTISSDTITMVSPSLDREPGSPGSTTPSTEADEPTQVSELTSTRPEESHARDSKIQPEMTSETRRVSFFDWQGLDLDLILPWLCGMQILAGILGVVVLLRKIGQGSNDSHSLTELDGE